MKRALIKSVNLLGDGLYIGPVAEQWYLQKGREFDEIHLLTIPGYVKPIYYGMGVPWAVVEEPQGEYDYEFTFDVSKAFAISDQQQIHLVQAYAQMMGIVKPGGYEKRPNYVPPLIEVPEFLRNRVWVSMFSMSCASRGNPVGPPNKMLPWDKWKPLIETLRREYPDNIITMLGAKEDKLEEDVANELGLHDYLTGVPIDYLANIMKYGKMIINVDNGMGHLAAAMRLNEFLLVPNVLGLHYIAPWGHKGLRLARIDPVTVKPEYINGLLKSAIHDWKERERLQERLADYGRTHFEV